MKDSGSKDNGDEIHEEAAPSTYKPPQEKDRDWMELASAVLLSLAMIATSWCAYQAARWGGLQSISFSEAATARNLAMAYITKAGQEILVDVDVFLEYANLFIEGELSEDALKAYADRLFSEELSNALDAWLATDPANNPDAPRNPFEMDAYMNPSENIAYAYSNIAKIKSQDAKDNNQQADNYVLLTVLFAIVLFFAGVATKFKSKLMGISMLVFGGLIFYVSALALSFQSVH
jgi:hypothetical protein